MSTGDAGTGVTTINKELLQYGGQAVIEGVMMRSPRYFAVACRKPDGSIVVQREEVDKSIIGRLKWLNKPFARGTLALIDAMALGTRALRFASNVQMQAEQEAAAHDPSAKHETVPAVKEEVVASAASLVNGPPVAASPTMPKSGRINDIAIGGTIVFSIIFGLLLFKLVPTLLTSWFQARTLGGAHANPHTLNMFDGLLRMVIFFGYIGLISMMPQIKRVFMYHGAEHKAINTLEAGLPLTTQNALRASRIHPRCGTSFIFVVLLIDLIVCAVLLPRPPSILARFAWQLAIVPVVAGISYEVIKLAGQYRRNPLVMAVFTPGMATQYLTTREPDSSQTEVALAALCSVLEAEGHHVRHDGIITAAAASSNPNEPEAVTA